jgi:hypothetical protein
MNGLAIIRDRFGVPARRGAIIRVGKKYTGRITGQENLTYLRAYFPCIKKTIDHIYPVGDDIEYRVDDQWLNIKDRTGA